MSNNNLRKGDNIVVAKAGTDRNVVIIDPNKVYDRSTGAVVDRYINQEDLVLYANLRIIKKPSTQIFHNELENKYDIINENELNILMLNPIKEINNGEIKYKNNFTIDYTDYFTSSNLSNTRQSNVGTYNELQNYFDPETFGITSISISQNSAFKPMVVIEFIDVQGKTLFESGDHPNSPYNFFYSLPYPTFILTVKGFYGKTIDIPLVLLKTNTKFDPETGSYRITAEFLSRTFSIYNNFLMVYAYLVPKMFKKDDGNYVGFEILKQIYDQQNDYYNKLYANNSDKRNKYVFNKGIYPTLSDLNVKDSLGSNASLDDAETETTVASLNELDATMTLLRQRYDEIIGNIQPQLEDNYMYTVTDIINSSINNISDTSVRNEIFTQSSLVNNGMFYDATNVAIKYTLLKPENLKYFKDVFQKIFTIIDKTTVTLNEKIINKKLINLKDKLGYMPNAYNVSRIVFNNIQAFLILMNIALKKALYQIKNDKDDNNNKRIPFHELHGEYGENNNGDRYYEPFPNYYIEEKQIDNNLSKTYKKVYPGYHNQNSGWAEVEFIDEIMKAIDAFYIQEHAKDQGLLGDTETFLMSNFDIKPDRNEAFNKKTNEINALSNMLDRLQLYYIYSGLAFKTITDTKLNEFIKQLQTTEFDYFTDIVLNQLDNQNKLKYTTNLLTYINSDTPVDKITNSLTSNLSADEIKKLKDEIRSEILKPKHNGDMEQIYKKYKKLNRTFTDLLSKDSSPVDDTSGVKTTTPVYLYDDMKLLNKYFTTPTATTNFSKSKDILADIYKTSKVSDTTYLYNQKHHKIIVTGATSENPIIIDPFDYNTTINDGDSKYKTLTTTINNNDVLIQLIGFNNSVLAPTATKNKYNF